MIKYINWPCQVLIYCFWSTNMLFRSWDLQKKIQNVIHVISPTTLIDLQAIWVLWFWQEIYDIIEKNLQIIARMVEKNEQRMKKAVSKVTE